MRHRVDRPWMLIVGAVLFAPGMGSPPVVHGAEVEVLVPGDHPAKVTVRGIERHYTVHVPPRCAGKSPVPLVIMLHGGGGTGRAAAYETGWATKADEAGFLAVFPDAVPRDPTKPASFAANPQLWNDGSDRFYEGQEQVDDVGFLHAMLDDLLVRFAADPNRIYVTGFSNGASMTFRFGAEASRRIAAIAPVAGACWIDPLDLPRPVPMCYITGTADPLNRIEGGVPKLGTGASDKVRSKPKPPVRASVEKWAKAMGCPTTPAETSDAGGVHREIYGPGPENSEVLYITVEEMGHTWAGGKSLLPEIMVGKRSDKIKANDVIWEFFQKHPLQAPPGNAPYGELRSSGRTRSPVAASNPSAPSLPTPTTPGRPAGHPQKDDEDRVFTLRVGELQREYLVHVPSGHDPDRPLPVVVAFHGGGSTARGMMRSTGLARKADEAGFLAVFPEGWRLDHQKPASFAENPQLWNDGSDRWLRRIDDVGFVRALLDDLATRFHVDQKRIYATGISTGSSLVYRLGIELSERLAAMAPVASSGLRCEVHRPRCGVPMLCIQGAADPRNPLEGGDPVQTLGRSDPRRPVRYSIETWAALSDCPKSPQLLQDRDGVRIERYGPGRDGAEVLFYLIEGMGHVWPGGAKSRLPEKMVGKDTDKIKANDVLWEFFQRHVRNGPC